MQPGFLRLLVSTTIHAAAAMSAIRYSAAAMRPAFRRHA
jgi:hypothetical protein